MRGAGEWPRTARALGRGYAVKPAHGLVPYQQGQLDGLCGVYALVNAIRLATAARTSDFSEAAWHGLFCALLEELDDTVGTLTALGYGIDEDPLREVAKAATTYMRLRHGVRVHVRRAINAREVRSVDCLLGELAEVVSRGATAVLVRLAGYVDHWTVLRSVTPHCLQLFDSSGHARINLANCRAKRDRSFRGRQHLLSAEGLLLVSADN